MILNGFCGFLDFNLFVFHTWLRKTGISTFEYIVNNKKKKMKLSKKA